ncbi:recombinase family protein [Rhodococcus ruber]|uniref:recombinase family protein n=1 Tax=Rhodococcus ruber TaxID=1830 RepID=UPI003783235B
MRAAIYARISLDRNNEGEGVERQLEACNKLAEQLGWNVSHTYVDNDISAYSGRTRPEFEALMQAMKQGAYDALICWHTDRLYRSIKDLERIIETADNQRMEIRTVQGGTIDLSNASGRMVARILGSVARQESEHASERRKLANEQRALNGEVYLNGRRPFGYTNTREPMPGEADAFRKAVQDVLAGKAVRAIAREWNDLGFRTTQKGNRWTGVQVSRILRSPTYAGLRVHRGKVVGKGVWEPLIDEETHHALAAFLNDPARRTSHSYERKYQGSGVYVCGVCGEPIWHYVGYSRFPRSYRCAKFHVRRKGEDLDEYVDEIVIARLSAPDAPSISVDDKAAIDVAGIRMKRSALQSRLDELASLFADGTIDGSQLKRGSQELREHIERLDAQLMTVHNVSPLALFAGNEDRVAELWAGLSPDLRGKTIDALMTVVVHPAGKPGPGFNPDLVEIRRKQ